MGRELTSGAILNFLKKPMGSVEMDSNYMGCWTKISKNALPERVKKKLRETRRQWLYFPFPLPCISRDVLLLEIIWEVLRREVTGFYSISNVFFHMPQQQMFWFSSNPPGLFLSQSISTFLIKVKGFVHFIYCLISQNKEVLQWLIYNKWISEWMRIMGWPKKKI